MAQERPFDTYDSGVTSDTGMEIFNSTNISHSPKSTRTLPATRFYGKTPIARGAENLAQYTNMNSSIERAGVRGQSSTMQRGGILSGIGDSQSSLNSASLLRSPNSLTSIRNKPSTSSFPSTSTGWLSSQSNFDIRNRDGMKVGKVDNVMKFLAKRQDETLNYKLNNTATRRSMSRPNRLILKPKSPAGEIRGQTFSPWGSAKGGAETELTIIDLLDNDGQKEGNGPFTRLIGFPNKGLTCYMNATLQALLALPCFNRHLLSLERRIKNWPSSEGLLQPLCKLARWKAEARSSKIDQTLTTFQKRLVVLSSQFEGIHNQDAHEFLVILCDAIHEECIKYAKLVAPEYNASDEVENQASPNVSQQLDSFVSLTDNQTLISKDFLFQLKETKICSLCNHKREEITSNYIFKLVIPPQSSRVGSEEKSTLDTLISNTLNSTAQLTCFSCRESKTLLGFEEVDADTPHQLCDVFVKLPKYLIIYCPRIEIYTVDSEQVESATSKVRFRKNQIPIEVSDTLVMSPFIDDIDAKNSRLGDDLLHKDKIRKRRHGGCIEDSSPGKLLKLSPPVSPKTIQTPSSILRTPINSRRRKTSSPAGSPKPIKVNTNTTLDPSPIKAILSSNSPFASPNQNVLSTLDKTPEELKNLTGDQVGNLSEADQLTLALRESLKYDTLNCTNQYEDVLAMSEEEQLSRAINASLNENNMSEEKQILTAIEDSLDKNDLYECSRFNENLEHFKENMGPLKSECIISQRGDADHDPKTGCINQKGDGNANNGYARENKDNNALKATPVDKDLSGEANGVRLSSNSEVMEFRNAFVDEMTKEAEDSQIKLKLGQTADDTNFEYKLSAIITHLGNSSTKCGHYVADVFSPEENGWYRYDDLKVTKKTLSDVLRTNDKDGYIFMYSIQEK